METLLQNAYAGGGANSIPTYVVGINATGSVIGELNELAVAGGVPVPATNGCDFSSGSLAIPAGAHTVSFRYDKDGSTSTGTDTVWIDDISIDEAGTVTFSDDFETGDFSGGTYTQTIAPGWAVDASQAVSGTMAMHNVDIGNNGQAEVSLAVNLTQAGTMSYEYRTDTESGWDYLEVWLDGVKQSSYAGPAAAACPQFYDSQNTAQFFSALDQIIGNLVTCDLILEIGRAHV